jgi:DNA-damage-inducible protein J
VHLGGAKMAKDTSISIRIDSELKDQAESIIVELGLNMTVVVNMLFRQIIRENAIPLSMSLNSPGSVLDDLKLSKMERQAGYRGTSFDDVIKSLEQIVAEAEVKYGKE